MGGSRCFVNLPGNVKLPVRDPVPTRRGNADAHETGHGLSAGVGQLPGAHEVIRHVWTRVKGDLLRP
jgi:hypothetical protein